MTLPAGDFQGQEWIVDALGCSEAPLRDASTLERVFHALVQGLELKPLGPPLFHTFPGAGGVTGMLMLSESHLTCHSFPERGYVAFNLYCCRPRAEWPWALRLGEVLGASQVSVRRVDRPGRSAG